MALLRLTVRFKQYTVKAWHRFVTTPTKKSYALIVLCLCVAVSEKLSAFKFAGSLGIGLAFFMLHFDDIL